ncbi:MAG TPA: hypothetical protein VIA62_02175 [Thermoanaerobaculia bacterium]|jgi:hypothetical protein|nr:hypothetical protein [Thermoanaerobaculia bacterium]
MKKRRVRKLRLASETLHRLDGAEVRKAQGRQDYQCGALQDSTAGFSGTPETYCVDTGTTMNSCQSICP